MSLLGDQLAMPAPTDHEVEQVLLGLADGSYVLSSPDGRVAECGVGVAALLATSSEDLAGRPVADVVAASGGPAQRAAFELVLRGERDAAAAAFATAAADGSARSLRFVVVCVPLALGWEFTALLGELGSRDADSWHPEALRLRHERALEAVEGVVRTGAQPDPGARLAGILIVVRDADAPALTREDVGRRMAQYRVAARAAKEAERRAALGLDAPIAPRGRRRGGPRRSRRARAPAARAPRRGRARGRHRARRARPRADPPGGHRSRARRRARRPRRPIAAALSCHGAAASGRRGAACRRAGRARRGDGPPAAAPAERDEVAAQLAAAQAERDEVRRSCRGAGRA